MSLPNNIFQQLTEEERNELMYRGFCGYPTMGFDPCGEARLTVIMASQAIVNLTRYEDTLIEKYGTDIQKEALRKEQKEKPFFRLETSEERRKYLSAREETTLRDHVEEIDISNRGLLSHLSNNTTIYGKGHTTRKTDKKELD